MQTSQDVPLLVDVVLAMMSLVSLMDVVESIKSTRNGMYLLLIKNYDISLKKRFSGKNKR